MQHAIAQARKCGAREFYIISYDGTTKRLYGWCTDDSPIYKYIHNIKTSYEDVLRLSYQNPKIEKFISE